MSDTVTIHALRHTLATIAYRTKRYLVVPPKSFPDLDMGHGVRTPIQILTHMNDVLAYACNALNPQRNVPEINQSNRWEAQVERFDKVMKELDTIFSELPELNPDTAARLLQGPLADVLTHAGQLGLLRRMAGDPIPGENFFEANIQVGDL